MEPVEAVVAGHLCLDIIPELLGDVAFEPGRLIEAGPAAFMTGGAVSNTGQSLYKLGVNVRLVGKVSTGLFSRAIKEILDQTGEGLSADLVESCDAATSYTIVLNLSGQDRTFLHAPGCNDIFASGDVSDQLLNSAKLMHFGYPPLMARMYANEGEELEDLFRRAKAQGCTTSLDLSLPDVAAASGRANWRAILKRVLPFVDLFLPSIEEAVFMLERPTFDALRGCRLSQLPESNFAKIAEEAHGFGAKVVGIKAGARGLYLHSQDTLTDFGRARDTDLQDWQGVELWAPSFQVDVQGTTGAGDATIAGLLMGLLRGMSVAESARAGVAVGASCCEQTDAVSGVKNWPETSHRIASGWPSHDAELDSGWEPRDGIFFRA